MILVVVQEETENYLDELAVDAHNALLLRIIQTLENIATKIQARKDANAE